MKRKFGPFCGKINARGGNSAIERLETKVDILELMDQMFAYRTKAGFKLLAFIRHSDRRGFAYKL